MHNEGVKGQARLVKKEGKAIHFWKCVLIAYAALCPPPLETVWWSECLCVAYSSVL